MNEELSLLLGFKSEKLYTVPKGTEGSWVAMTVDPIGRLITGDQYGGLYRVTVPPVFGEMETQVEKLKEDWSQAKEDMEDIADRAKTEGEEAVQEAKDKAERHYEALQAAVKAYRDHLDQVTDT